MKKEHVYIGVGISLLILLGYALKDMILFEDFRITKKRADSNR